MTSRTARRIGGGFDVISAKRNGVIRWLLSIRQMVARRNGKQRSLQCSVASFALAHAMNLANPIAVVMTSNTGAKRRWRKSPVVIGIYGGGEVAGSTLNRSTRTITKMVIMAKSQVFRDEGFGMPPRHLVWLMATNALLHAGDFT
jgi:hypothetical protein